MPDLLFNLALLLAAAAPTPAPIVHTHGQLRAVMHERDLSGKVTLASVLARPHTYAVGALSDLRGEVTIIDGAVWLAYPGPQGKLRVEQSLTSDERATLLVSASVPSWKRVKLTRTIRFADLDAALEALAKENGVDPAKPFPFS